MAEETGILTRFKMEEIRIDRGWLTRNVSAHCSSSSHGHHRQHHPSGNNGREVLLKNPIHERGDLGLELLRLLIVLILTDSMHEWSILPCIVAAEK